MSKCILCGNELLTGDIHWEQGLCNYCYKKTEYPNPFQIIYDKRKLDIREKYIEKLEQENKILKEALELACEKISNTEKNITFNFCYNFYLEQAKESIDENRNKI